jgi:hypothetical protein
MAPPKLRKCTNPGDLWLSPNVENAVPDEVCPGDRRATTVPSVSLVLARAQTLVRFVPVLVVLCSLASLRRRSSQLFAT